MTVNGRARFTWGAIFPLLKQTFNEWLEDKAPQLGAALAYYTVFSLAPLILLLLAIVGVLFRSDPSGAWTRITEQMGYFLDQSALDVVQQIAQKAAQPNKSAAATIAPASPAPADQPACCRTPAVYEPSPKKPAVAKDG